MLGTIVAVDSTQRNNKEETEYLYDQAYLGEDSLNGITDLNDQAEDIDENAAEVNAEGTVDSGIMEEQAVSGTGSTGNESTVENAQSENMEEAAADVTGEENADEVSSGTVTEASSANIISEEDLLAANVIFDETDTLLWPAAGTILIDYSMDGSVYFPTLNQYKYNPALVIKSEAGNQVVSSAKGIVENITVNEVTGLTMTVNIGNGYRLVYGQLKEAAASEGDIVEAGSVIGYVSEPTRFYTKEGSNLYFQMTQNGDPVDPVLYLE